jgi:uncharacterized protein (DUF488 family)
MQSREFKKSVEQLIKIAAEKQTAIICAEAIPWLCHRSLIGDSLAIRDIKEEDIMSGKFCKPHTVTWFPKVNAEGLITYLGETL